MDHSAHEHRSHDQHAGHRTEDFLRKFLVTLVLTIPIIVYSDLPGLFVGWTAPLFPGSTYLPAVLGTVIFFYGGLVFLKGAWREIQNRLPGMMTLIALAISAAYLYSMAVTFLGNGMALYWELATLIAVMLIGHWIEMRAVQGARGALHELAKLLPENAEVIRDGKRITILSSELRVGDIVLIRPGGKVPADGIVIDGDSEMDESFITGESRPVAKHRGSAVIAGAINSDGSLKIRVEKSGDKTFLAGVIRLVAEAEQSKSRLQLLSDRAAFYLTVLAVSVGAVTFSVWIYAGQGVGFATERLVAVLVIACPHALGLAIPLVASISTTMAARSGFFVKNRLALEAARSITTVLFDKTGTLTKGVFSVTAVTSDDVLALAASVESGSEHPIGKAIVREAGRRGIPFKHASDFKRIPGAGAQGIVDGSTIFVGHRGGSDIVIEMNGKQVGTVTVADTVRPEARKAVDALKQVGLSVLMITGDSQEIAERVAQELSIDDYFARVHPEEKSEKIKQLQAQGKRVAMVGDGVNDAPALAQADLGIAIGAGTNVAIESAGIILVQNDPRDIPKIIKLSRLTYSKMIQNLFWATGYNVAALPIAAGVLAPLGVMLEPAVAAVFMSASTVIVALNAALLRRKHI